MSHYLGDAIAKDFGDAHEYASTDPQVAIDRAYANNASGRTIGSRLRSAGAEVDDAEIAAAVLSYLWAGRLDARSAVGLPGRWD